MKNTQLTTSAITNKIHRVAFRRIETTSHKRVSRSFGLLSPVHHPGLLTLSTGSDWTASSSPFHGLGLRCRATPVDLCASYRSFQRTVLGNCRRTGFQGVITMSSVAPSVCTTAFIFALLLQTF